MAMGDGLAGGESRDGSKAALTPRTGCARLLIADPPRDTDRRGADAATGRRLQR